MAIDQEVLLVIQSAGLGSGEPDLGEKLLKSFLRMFLESERLPAKMIFMSSGIFLTTEGSPVLDLLKSLEEQGTEIATCGTCLEYYQRKEKLLLGKIGNMRETVNAMQAFPKVLMP